jgi:hypothetical protein
MPGEAGGVGQQRREPLHPVGCKHSARAAELGIVRGLPDDGVLKMNAFN